MKRVCRSCGKPEHEHCVPDWIEVPDGCVCDPLTWDGDKIPPACDGFQGTEGKPCRRCEHDKECHKC